MALLVRSGDSNASISGSIRPFNSALEISIRCNLFRQALRTSHLAQGAAVPPRLNLTHMAAPKPGRQASCKVQPRSVLLAFEMTKSNPQHHSPVIPVGTAVLLPKGALLQSSHHLLHFLSSVFSLLHFCFHPPSSTSKKKNTYHILKKLSSETGKTDKTYRNTGTHYSSSEDYSLPHICAGRGLSLIFPFLQYQNDHRRQNVFLTAIHLSQLQQYITKIILNVLHRWAEA